MKSESDVISSSLFTPHLSRLLGIQSFECFLDLCRFFQLDDAADGRDQFGNVALLDLLLDLGICAGNIENWRRPMPRSNERVSCGSPASSPHIETGMSAFFGTADNVRKQHQHRRMQRVDGNLLIAAVDGQRVLDPGHWCRSTKIQPAAEGPMASAAAGTSDHAADFDFFIKGDAFAAQAGLGLFQRPGSDQSGERATASAPRV